MFVRCAFHIILSDGNDFIRCAWLTKIASPEFAGFRREKGKEGGGGGRRREKERKGRRELGVKSTSDDLRQRFYCFCC
jgi:hypothetical protein